MFVSYSDITVEMVMNAFPFQDTVDLIEIKGKYLRETFEHSVSRQGASNNGRFLQVSGKTGSSIMNAIHV